MLDRTKRIKEAREEAKKEIDAYKKQKEAEFKEFEAQVCHARPYTSHHFLQLPHYTATANMCNRRERQRPKDRIVNGELTPVSTPAAISKLRRTPTRKLRCR